MLQFDDARMQADDPRQAPGISPPTPIEEPSSDDADVPTREEPDHEDDQPSEAPMIA